MEPVLITVELPEPIGDIKSIQLRKPTAGEMRGIKMLDLYQLEVGTVETLLKRVATPLLTPQQFHNLDIENLTALIAGLNEFFMGKHRTPAE